MKALNSLSFLSSKPFFFLFSSLSSPIQTPNSNSLTNFLTESLKFSQTQALSISTRFSVARSPQNPQSVVQFFRNLGLSDTQIRSSVLLSPQILFSDIDKTLKPKLEFFQELGLAGSDLGKFISKSSTLLAVSLERKLIPCIEILKKILVDDENNENLIRVMRRCNRIVGKCPESGLLCNIAFLESCGIVGSQVSMLLTRQPRIFIVPESKLRELVSRVLDMGFSLNSRMLVHALHTVSCLSIQTFRRKLDLLRRFGFSEEESMEMFRKAPVLLRTSEEKLMLGIEFFMITVKLNKSVLIRGPRCLMYSMEERVFPRYRVLQIMKSKRLLKKEPSFITMLSLTEEEFLDKFISRYRDDAEELLVAYKAHNLDSLEEHES